MFVYHFVYPDLGCEIFFQKEEATEKGRVDFGKKRLRQHLRNLVLCFEELFMQSLSAFLLFFSDKKRIA